MDNKEHFLAFLKTHPAVRFVRLLWLDYTSTLRVRVLTARHYLRLSESGRAHGLGRLYMTLIDNDAPLAASYSNAGTGQAYLMPDLSSLRVCPWMENHATVFCFFRQNESDPKHAVGHEDTLSELCPRLALRKCLADTTSKGERFLVGFEIEFTCTMVKDPAPAESLPRVHQASGLRTLESVMLPILCKIAESLERIGIDVEHFHAEAEIDQFELVTAPYSPLEAVDNLIITRETIRKISSDHGVDVSFHPSHPANNGLHLNISLLGMGSTVRDVEDCFLAGILDHLASIFGFGLPHPESYIRTSPGHQCIGRYKTWGTQNREAPIRRKGAGFWEMRFLDSSTNVYLCLAALLYAGRSGIESEAQLTLSDCNGNQVSVHPHISELTLK
ncbi:hypothetical protein BDV96DRAFT_509882 [Lophiotrema nucula]|uniref:Glutamine synthetase n=1 Tax=Lophiotrema nucula TaxID=690887 RepID=A0A6A5YDJ6_9PLEO|nr:hypothetical protein BDV96DRAFT_509882 [Lophiotrema nucula]